MLALMTNVVEFFILVLVNMHRSMELASHNLVHQKMLHTALSLKGTSTSISLHNAQKNAHASHSVQASGIFSLDLLLAL